MDFPAVGDGFKYQVAGVCTFDSKINPFPVLKGYTMMPSFDYTLYMICQ